jgi:hypothetical protein
MLLDMVATANSTVWSAELGDAGVQTTLPRSFGMLMKPASFLYEAAARIADMMSYFAVVGFVRDVKVDALKLEA